MAGFFKNIFKMKALELKTPLKIYLIPRIYPEISDVLVLNLRNEMTGEVLNPSFTFEIGQKLEITINEDVSYFKEFQKFDIELTNGGDIIYLGKLITLKEGVNTQEYEYRQQTNARFDYK